MMMIEAAWIWLPYQPDSALARWFRERVGQQQGRMRRIAIVVRRSRSGRLEGRTTPIQVTVDS